jgi:hydroxymethylpyrimidine pyrophosphatase-like HAD family hydrolase
LLITDIDGTLIGCDASLRKLQRILNESNGRIILGVVTGRSPALVQEVFDQYEIRDVSLIIASVGSEILVGPHGEELAEWCHHIAADWDPEN